MVAGEEVARHRRDGAALGPVPWLDFVRGDVLARMGRHAEAEQALRAEIQRFPSHARAYASLAIVRSLQGAPLAESRQLLADMSRAAPGAGSRELAAKARAGKLSAAEMQGGCFTISSLGGIGGTAFTPIINAPEVAILGVSRSQQRPVWQGGKFEPRLMLDGPIDSAVPTDVADAVLATLRESLSNVAKHAGATVVDVELSVGSEVLVRVCDNGSGLRSKRSGTGHGLANMEARARRLGGGFEIVPGPTKGSIVVWRVPLGAGS